MIPSITAHKLIPVDVKAPTRVILRNEDLFPKDPETGQESVNVLLLRDHFFEEGKLQDEQVLKIISMGSALLRPEPNLIEVATPVTSKWHL